MSSKDSFTCQRARIERISRQAFPNFHVEFKPAEGDSIEFRLRLLENESGHVFASTPVDMEWAVTEVADWSDDKVRMKLMELLNRGGIDLSSPE